MLRRVDLIRCAVAILFVGCTRSPGPKPSATSATPQPGVPSAAYFDNTGRDDVLTGGVKMIPIDDAEGHVQASGPSASATTRGSRCCCCTAARA